MAGREGTEDVNAKTENVVVGDLAITLMRESVRLSEVVTRVQRCTVVQLEDPKKEDHLAEG